MKVANHFEALEALFKEFASKYGKSDQSHEFFVQIELGIKQRRVGRKLSSLVDLSTPAWVPFLLYSEHQMPGHGARHAHLTLYPYQPRDLEKVTLIPGKSILKFSAFIVEFSNNKYAGVENSLSLSVGECNDSRWYGGYELLPSPHEGSKEERCALILGELICRAVELTRDFRTVIYTREPKE